MAQPNVLEAMLLVAEENFISEQNLVKLHLDQKPPLPGQARDTWNGLFVEFQTKVSAAQAVYLQAKEAVEQQRLGIQAKTVKPTKLPSPDGGPKFSHGLKTTAKNVTDFMALFEHHVSRQNFPKTENGRNRWVDALPSYFAEPKATLEDLDFMRTHAEANTQWPNFKVEFANRYVKDHTTLEAASLLDKCKQQGRAIDVFATEFKKRFVAANFQSGVVVANWSTATALGSKLCQEKLDTALVQEMLETSNLSLFAEASKSVDTLLALALKVQQESSMKAGILLARGKVPTTQGANGNSSKHGGSFGVTKNGDKRAGKPKSTKPSTKNDGDSNSLREQCRKDGRCYMFAIGGASKCHFGDRCKFTHEPAADAADKLKPKKRECWNCGSEAHTAATCPKKAETQVQGKGRPLAVKATKKGGHKRQRVTVRKEHRGSQADDDDDSSASE